MSFNDFVHKSKSKNKALSSIIFYRILCSIGWNNVGIYLRDGPFESDLGSVSLHPTKETYWVVYTNENNFDSYGCPTPNKLSKFIIKRKGLYLNSE